MRLMQWLRDLFSMNSSQKNESDGSELRDLFSMNSSQKNESEGSEKTHNSRCESVKAPYKIESPQTSKLDKNTLVAERTSLPKLPELKVKQTSKYGNPKEVFRASRDTTDNMHYRRNKLQLEDDVVETIVDATTQLARSYHSVTPMSDTPSSSGHSHHSSHNSGSSHSSYDSSSSSSSGGGD